jgi:hypothetical protein
MDYSNIERTGVFVETALTHEQVERAILAEVAQGIAVGDCAFLTTPL